MSINPGYDRLDRDLDANRDNLASVTITATTPDGRSATFELEDALVVHGREVDGDSLTRANREINEIRVVARRGRVTWHERGDE